MTGLALVCAGLAAGLWAGPSRRVAGPAPGTPERPPRRVWWPVPVAVGVMMAVWLGAGPRAAVPVTAAVMVLGTAARVLVVRRRVHRARSATAEVSRACTVLVSELELGKVPATALAAAAEDCPVLAQAAAAAGIGGDPVEVWQAQAAQPGHAGLLVLARAWQVARITGAPLAPSLETVASALRADEDVDRLVAGELAAPRMTGVLLAFLPVVGLILGRLIGGDPVGFLLGQPIGWACLIGGCGLACAGVLWTEHLGGSR